MRSRPEPTSVTRSASVCVPVSSCVQAYVAPATDEPAPDSVTCVLRTIPDWSGPALATTAPCGVTGPNTGDTGPNAALTLFIARTVNQYGVSPVSP